MSSKMRVYEYKTTRKARAVKVADRAVAYQPANNDTAVAALVRGIVGQVPREHLIFFYTDSLNRVLGYEIHAIGSQAAVFMFASDAYRSILLSGAQRVILAHNHPSNTAEPSKEDDELTRRMKKTCELIGVPLVDHVIVTDSAFYSYQAHGRL